MFRWVERLGFGVKDRAVNSPAIRLLAVSRNDQFYAMLVDLASASGWEIRRASTVPEALDVLHTAQIPLVLFDWDEHGDDWRESIKRLGASGTHPCVLLASRFIDDNLRQEVLRFRGYDVLPKSAGQDEIVRTIQFAWFWITRSQQFGDTRNHQEARH